MCTRLRTLDISHHERISDLAPLSNLTSLRHLRLHHCHLVSSLEPLRFHPHLASLNIRWTKVPSLEPLEGHSLTELDISSCQHLTCLQPLGALPQLRKLHLGSSFKSSLAVLSPCVHMEDLDLSSMRRLSSLEILGPMTNLRRLNLQGCSSVTCLEALGSLSRLQALDLTMCNGLPPSALSPLSSCTSLMQLDLKLCRPAFDLFPLASCHNLRRLYTSRRPNLPQLDLSPLQDLVAGGRLQILDEQHHTETLPDPESSPL
jgi:Leucine-rich repeat (LRR) protein